MLRQQNFLQATQSQKKFQAHQDQSSRLGKCISSCGPGSLAYNSRLWIVVTLQLYKASLPKPLKLPILWLLNPSCLVLLLVQFVKVDSNSKDKLVIFHGKASDFQMPSLWGRNTRPEGPRGHRRPPQKILHTLRYPTPPSSPRCHGQVISCGISKPKALVIWEGVVV